MPLVVASLFNIAVLLLYGAWMFQGLSLDDAGGRSMQMALGGGGSPLISGSSVDIDNVAVTAIVFCCRSPFFEILDTYLLKSLRVNGGVVDNVVFLMNLRERDNVVNHVAEAVSMTPEYSMVDYGRFVPFTTLYEAFDDSSRVYIKLDDDIVYMSPNAIHDLVSAQLNATPSQCLFSANVINHTRLSNFHQKHGAMIPLYPSDPRDMRKPFTAEAPPMEAEQALPTFYYENDAYGNCSFWSPMCALVVHENFLRNVRKPDRLELYKGPPDIALHNLGVSEEPHLVENKHNRWSINFIALTKEIVDKIELPTNQYRGSYHNDDENVMTAIWTKDEDCESVAVTSSLVVHFSYHPTTLFLLARTDLLQRYRQLAIELNGDPRGWLSRYPRVNEPALSE